MTDRSVRLARRARLQLILAVAAAVLTMLAMAVPAWIEQFTGLDPDRGDGSLEILLPIAFAVAALTLGGLSRRTRRQLARHN